VVANSKSGDPRERIASFMYFPYAQDPKMGHVTFYVRTSQDPASAANALRAALAAVDSALPVYGLMTVEERRDQSIFTERFMAALCVIMGLLAAVLAAIGLYGLMGAGRTELMETLFGLHPKRASGNILVNEQPVTIHTPVQAIKQGIALVPEDRKAHGLILDQKIKTNISITVLQQLEKWGVVLHNKKETQLSKEYIQQLGIKTHSENNIAGNLSGGNQQKIVLAKWLATNPQILLLDEPTRGIDINARFEIYTLMKKLAAAGMAILLVSSELPEILTASHRVLVMAEGRLTADMPVAEATESTVLKYAIQHNIIA